MLSSTLATLALMPVHADNFRGALGAMNPSISPANNLLLTGPPRCGKTTVVRRQLPNRMQRRRVDAGRNRELPAAGHFRSRRVARRRRLGIRNAPPRSNGDDLPARAYGTGGPTSVSRHRLPPYLIRWNGKVDRQRVAGLSEFISPNRSNEVRCLPGPALPCRHNGIDVGARALPSLPPARYLLDSVSR